jgi:geranylgeranyl diphosphate synthase type I
MSLTDTSTVPAAIGHTRELVEPALRAAVAAVPDERMRRVAGYQLGFCDPDGAPVRGGGKLIRPTLALLSAQAAGAAPSDGVPAGVALELVHNFSLLHDDIMDRDTERRHRATGWVVFGEGQAILAGNAMLTAAIQALTADQGCAARTVPALLDMVQRLISGQSADLALERRERVSLDEVVDMEAGKTAALLSCASSLGALAAGAPGPVIDALRDFGHLMGRAFQLVDDVLGVTGDPNVTGKSASSDVRAGKRSAVVVAALHAGTNDAQRLGRLLAAGPPASEDDVALATTLIVDSGGVEWASAQADRLLSEAVDKLAQIGDPYRAAVGPVAELAAVARYVVARDR